MERDPARGEIVPRELSSPSRAATIDPLLTIPEVARTLAVSALTVRRLIRSGQLPCVRVGVQIRVQPRDLLRWISARKEGR
jgi:excisionase family DNA binding protein